MQKLFEATNRLMKEKVPQMKQGELLAVRRELGLPPTSNRADLVKTAMQILVQGDFM